MSEAIARIEPQELALERPSPKAIIRQATEEANELASVIESRKLFSMIQGKKFVKCEGWTTLACLRGCLPREVSVTEMPEGRYIAEVELVRMSDQMVITRASAECGGPEDSVWTKRPPNARRSMAITRATGKACRVAFSWVMALSGYEVTPAEEMDHVGGGIVMEETGPAPRATQTAPRPQPARGELLAAVPVWRGKLVNMISKDGTTNNKPWTLFKFTGDDGQSFGTFSDTVAQQLTALDGHFVEIVYEAKKNGNHITEFRDVSSEEVPL